MNPTFLWENALSWQTHCVGTLKNYYLVWIPTGWKTIMWKLMTTKHRRLSISFNPRPARGTFERPPTSGFSRLAKIRRRAAPPGFHPPYPHLFRNFCENFGPMPCEVRSPGQVKWPNYKITFQSRPTATMFQGKLRTFQNMMSSSVPTKRISRIFFISVTSGQVIFATSPL